MLTNLSILLTINILKNIKKQDEIINQKSENINYL